MEKVSRRRVLSGALASGVAVVGGGAASAAPSALSLPAVGRDERLDVAAFRRWLLDGTVGPGLSLWEVPEAERRCLNVYVPDALTAGFRQSLAEARAEAARYGRACPCKADGCGGCGHTVQLGRRWDVLVETVRSAAAEWFAPLLFGLYPGAVKARAWETDGARVGVRHMERDDPKDGVISLLVDWPAWPEKEREKARRLAAETPEERRLRIAARKAWFAAQAGNGVSSGGG